MTRHDDLLAFADYADRMATSRHVSNCRYADRRDRRPAGWTITDSTIRATPTWSPCLGPSVPCHRLADRELWAQLAVEARSHLDQPTLL